MTHSASPVATGSPHWPPGLARHLTVPETHLWFNAEVSAARFPDKPFIIFGDTPVTFREFRDQAERIAGFLQQGLGVKRGDRVMLFMQNSPQWMLACYGILRADAVVVPVNPMNRTEELRHCMSDSGARCAIVAQDLFDEVAPLMADGGTTLPALDHVVVATYSDFLRAPTDLSLPAEVTAPRRVPSRPGVTAWADIAARDLLPGPLASGPDDVCVLPYTSGTTGRPKGCIHTHRTVMCTLLGGLQWFARTQDTVYLSVLPFFHVTGLAGGLNAPLYSGATVVVLPRWDRMNAARLIERYRVSSWQVIATMMVDFLSHDDVRRYDLSSLDGIRGGGAPMPEAVAAELHRRTGLHYVEGYGMSETMAATHINPPHRPKPQCLGLPVFDVDARVIDPVSLEPVPPGDVGEIVVHAPQVMAGYWNDPDGTRAAFIDIGGRRFLRTGDLGRVDEDGYFFMVDRLKRMINAAGYKVWPAEVENLMYAHPAVQEVCVIPALDPRRGETVKAVVVLRASHRGQVTEADLMAWAHERMAAYKSPRVVQFVDALPKSASGKVLWRELQAKENAGTH